MEDPSNTLIAYLIIVSFEFEFKVIIHHDQATLSLYHQP